MGVQIVATILVASYLAVSHGQYSLYTNYNNIYRESGYVWPYVGYGYVRFPYHRPYYRPSWRYGAAYPADRILGGNDNVGTVRDGDGVAALIVDAGYLGFGRRYGWGYYGNYGRGYGSYGFGLPHGGGGGDFGVPMEPVPMWLLFLISIQPRQDGRPQGPPGSDEKGQNVEPGTPGGGDNVLNGINVGTGDRGTCGGSSGRNSNAIYTIWGTGTCPASDKAFFSGYTALAIHQDSGSDGVINSLLCLPDSSVFHSHQVSSTNNHISVVSVIYNTGSDESPLSFVNGCDVECAVCFTQESVQLMIPGTSVCPMEPGWSTIYTGYLMSSRDSPSETLYDETSHFHSEYICIDISHTTDTRSTNSDTQIYHVYHECDTQDCSSKPSEPLTCAVCSYSSPPPVEK